MASHKKSVESHVTAIPKFIPGNHAIGTVRKFPTLPLNPNGVWIDPTGGVWRQASTVGKDGHIADYAQISQAPTLQLPDYER